MSSKKSRRRFTLEQKYAILTELDSPGCDKKKIMMETGVNSDIIYKWKKNSEKIKHVYEKGSDPSRKSLKGPKHPIIDQKLTEFIQSNASKGCPVNGVILTEKTKRLREELNIPVPENWTSNGYLQKYRKRESVHFVTSYGEADAVPQKVIDDWMKKLPNIISGYSMSDIFNADELGLFWKLLPSKSYVMKGDKFKSGKRSKERVSVLLASNSNGSEKLPPVVIGRWLFKNKHKPLAYYTNRRSWMTEIIFQDGVSKLNKKMISQNRNILMFIDNVSGHNLHIRLSNVKIIFLPPNTTSVLQPMDQGIIKCFKQYYRQKIASKLVWSLERNPNHKISDVKFDLVTCMHYMKIAWDGVKSATIANCFKKSGFPVMMQIEVAETSTSDDFVSTLQNMGHDVSSGEEFITADDDLVAAGTTETSIEEEDQSDNDDDDIQSEFEQNSAKIPKSDQVGDAIDLIRNYALHHGLCETFLYQLDNFESEVIRHHQNSRIQTKITDYLLNTQK